MRLRIFQKFAYGDDVFISMKMGLNPETDEINGSNTLHLLTFDQCATHIRHEVCDALDADKTHLAPLER